MEQGECGGKRGEAKGSARRERGAATACACSVERVNQENELEKGGVPR